MFDPKHKISFLKCQFRKVYQSEDEVYEQIERVRFELVNLSNDYTSTLSSSIQAHQASTYVDLASFGSCTHFGSCFSDSDGYR